MHASLLLDILYKCGERVCEEFVFQKTAGPDSRFDIKVQIHMVDLTFSHTLQYTKTKHVS